MVVLQQLKLEILIQAQALVFDLALASIVTKLSLVQALKGHLPKQTEHMNSKSHSPQSSMKTRSRPLLRLPKRIQKIR